MSRSEAEHFLKRLVAVVKNVNINVSLLLPLIGELRLALLGKLKDLAEDGADAQKVLDEMLKK